MLNTDRCQHVIRSICQQALLLAALAMSLCVMHPSSAYAWTKDGTVYSTNGSYSDVASAISNATDRDTVLIPAGAFTWPSTVVIQKNIVLQGEGGYPEANTTITSTATTAISLNSAKAGGIRITGIKFNKTGGTIIDISAPVVDFRFDHLHFNFTNSGGILVNINYNSFTVPLQGLVDNCRFEYGRFYLLGQTQGTLWGFATWSNDTDLGGKTFLYVEDCVGYNWKDGPRPMHIMDGNTGVGFVSRNNHFYGYYFEGHGIQQDERGLRKWEIYRTHLEADYNEITYRNQANAFYLRSGTGVIFQNEVRGFNKNHAYFYNYRWSSPRGSIGQCNGSSPYDNNENSAGYLCLDQLGAGKDQSTRTVSNPYPRQEHQPIYVWGNTSNDASYNVVSTSGTSAWAFNSWFQPDRDVFVQGYGSVGIGSGVLASRPTNCTTGQGYWATDQGNWNKGTTGDWVGQQGVLYKCASTDKWEIYYTPYEYPHPLRNGQAESVIAPRNLKVIR